MIPLFFLLLASSFFSMSETALFSLGKFGAKRIENRVLERLLMDPKKLLVDLLTANTFVNVLFSVFGTYYAIKISRDIGISEEIGVGIGIWIMTIVLIVGGEIIPKSLAVRQAESIAKKVAYPIRICSIILAPIRRIFFGIADVLVPSIEMLLRLKSTRVALNEEDLSIALKIGEEERIFEEGDFRMMRGILKFGKGVVRDVMVPKERIVCCAKDSTVEDVLRLIYRTGYSRIPLYQGEPKNIVGVVHAKDFVPYLSSEKEIPLSRFIRNIYIVSPEKRINELLHEMQAKRCQIAIVKDKNNHLLGLVTMEDLLEEIVGEIEDEYDLLSMSKGVKK